MPYCKMQAELKSYVDAMRTGEAKGTEEHLDGTPRNTYIQYTTGNEKEDHNLGEAISTARNPSKLAVHFKDQFSQDPGLKSTQNLRHRDPFLRFYNFMK